MKNDKALITSKYAGDCVYCQKSFSKGTKILWSATTRETWHPDCYGLWCMAKWGAK